MSNVVAQPSVPTDPKERETFFKRAAAGDVTTLRGVREHYQNVTKMETFERHGIELAQSTQRLFLRDLFGHNLANIEIHVRRLELMRDELAGPNPTPTERLLAERAIACYMQVEHAERLFANLKDLSPGKEDHRQRRIDAAHRRYMSALKTLALVRKLALSVLVQVTAARAQAPQVAPPPIRRRRLEKRDRFARIG